MSEKLSENEIKQVNNSVRSLETNDSSETTSNSESIQEFKSVEKSKGISNFVTENKSNSQEKLKVISSFESINKSESVEKKSKSSESASTSSFSTYSYHDSEVASVHNISVWKKKLKKRILNEMVLFLVVVIATMLFGTIFLRREEVTKCKCSLINF